MKLELLPLVESPLTPEEEHELLPLLEELTRQPDKKLVITLEEGETSLVVRKKVTYLCDRMKLKLTLSKRGDTFQVTTGTRKKKKRRPKPNTRDA